MAKILKSVKNKKASCDKTVSIPLDDIKLSLADWVALEKACKKRKLHFPEDLGLLAELEISAARKR